mgnify:CR=1 FL=1
MGLEIAKGIDDALAASLSSGDVEAALELYADDVIILPPDLPMVVGKPQLRPLIEELTSSGLKIRYEQTKVQSCDDTIINIGRGIGQLKDQQVFTKHILILKKQPEGKWLIAADSYTFDSPLT